MKERDYNIDVVAGIMVGVMILSHCGVQIDALNFFMPWFFFKSGMYFKEKTFKEYISTSGLKLMFPYVTFTIIGYFFHSALIFLQRDYNIIHYTLTPIKEIVFSGGIEGMPLWFFPSLYLTQIIYLCMYNRGINPWYIICLVTIVLLGFNQLSHLPLWCSNVCLGLIYYSIGYIMKEKQYIKIVFCGSFMLYLIIYLCNSPTMIMKDNCLLHGNYFLWFVFCISGCIAFNNIFLYLRKCWMSQIFNTIGIYAMPIYVTHGPLLLLGAIMAICLERCLNITIPHSLYVVLLILLICICELLIISKMYKTHRIDFLLYYRKK